MATTPNIIDTSLITSTSGILFESKYLESVNILDQNDLKLITEQFGPLDTSKIYIYKGVTKGLGGVFYIYIDNIKFTGLPSTSNLNGKWVRILIENSSDPVIGNNSYIKLTLIPQSNQLTPQGTGNTIYTITSVWSATNIQDTLIYSIKLSDNTKCVYYNGYNYSILSTISQNLVITYIPGVKNYYYKLATGTYGSSFVFNLDVNNQDKYLEYDNELDIFIENPNSSQYNVINFTFENQVFYSSPVTLLNKQLTIGPGPLGITKFKIKVLSKRSDTDLIINSAYILLTN